MDQPGVLIIGLAATIISSRTFLAWKRVQAVRDAVQQHHKPKPSMVQRAKSALLQIPTNMRSVIILGAVSGIAAIVPLMFGEYIDGPQGTMCWTVAKWCLIGSCLRAVRSMGQHELG
jgi:hypothetical protein